jgi:integrase/recombinase XerD
LTLAHTGMRVGELVDLRLGDLDLAGGRIFIPSAKNGQERVVYLTPALVTALRNFLSIRPVTNDDHLWQYDGRRLTDEKARNCVARWGEKCGIRVTPHRLRHTFATRLLNQGVSLEVVRKLLGHSSLQMSQHYARLYDSTVKDQFESAAGELEGVVVRNWPMPAATPVPVQADFQQVDSV